MHQSTDTHHTTKDLTPEEIKEYQKRLDKHLQNRKVDEALLQRAWHTAHKIAAMLYEEFGAEQVAVFGSLAERCWFSKESDIDIAVWGLSNDKYLDALWETVGFSQEFKIDLVDFNETTGRYRQRIQNQSVYIQNDNTGVTTNNNILMEKDETHQVNKHNLIARIADERAKIERTVGKIKVGLQKLKTAHAEDLEDLTALLALRIADFYSGLESIFNRIAQHIDMNVPTGEKSHKSLLQQMAEVRPMRSPVISEQTLVDLDRILKFRHRFRHIYAFELKQNKVKNNAKRISEVYDNLSIELDGFIAWLEKQTSNM